MLKKMLRCSRTHKPKISLIILILNFYFTLPACSATNVVTWNCHVDDSDKGRYNKNLGHDLLKYLGLNLKLSEHIIKVDDGPFNGCTTPMVDLGAYIFKYLNTGKLHLNNSLLMLM